MRITLAASRFRRYRGRVGMNRSSLSNMNHHRESFRPHLLIVRAHEDAGTSHMGMRSPDEIAGRHTPLAGALAPHGVSGTGAGSPLGPTHNPGRAALTRASFGVRGQSPTSVQTPRLARCMYRKSCYPWRPESTRLYKQLTPLSAGTRTIPVCATLAGLALTGITPRGRLPADTVGALPCWGSRVGRLPQPQEIRTSVRLSG